VPSLWSSARCRRAAGRKTSRNDLVHAILSCSQGIRRTGGRALEPDIIGLMSFCHCLGFDMLAKLGRRQRVGLGVLFRPRLLISGD